MLFILALLATLVAFGVWQLMKRRVRAGWSGYRSVSSLAALAMIFFALIAVTQIFTVIPAGHVGVVDFFGIVSDRELKPGINLVNPLARIVKFSVKTQEVKEEMDVPSKEGLTVRMETSVLFHLDPDKAADVYKTVGPNYVEIILVPQFRSVTRGVTAAFEAKALYTAQREEITRLLQRDLERLVAPRGIMVETTPLRRIGLPASLTQAIEAKLGSEQESQRMEFVLTREKQEAERKRIEAQGISDFQNIVARGISNELLRWKGIEATEKLAASPNSKIVVIGSGRDGLPLILNAAN